MRRIFIPLAGLLFPFIFSSLAHAKLDIQKDCLEAAKIFAIPATELSSFRSWCERFEASCYELEASSAKACGGNGTQEANGREQLRLATANLGGGTSYQSGTAAGLDALESAIITRKFQLQICHVNLDKCKARSSTFQSQTGVKTLACSNFTPESEMWEASAKAAPDMCQATALEIARVRDELAIAETQKNGMASVQSASQAEPPAEPPSTSNQAIRLPAEDSRACGMFGCEANADGTFSPRYAPGN